MEEDVAKLIHDEISGEVLVDLNRSGMPLLEVVTEPDFRSAVEAENYLTNLQSIVRYLEIGNANMEEGSFRCDANVSIRKKGTNVLNEKVEIKNMNRIKAVSRAIEYEIKRQKSEVESGNRIIQETRGWDDIKSESIPQRSKEDAHDYRYFPEPDLPVIKLNSEDINKIKNELPELPDKFFCIVDSPIIFEPSFIVASKSILSRVDGTKLPFTFNILHDSSSAVSKFPVIFSMARINKFPKEWPFKGSLPSNLCWNNFFKRGSASDNATRQFLKSPGGSIPNPSLNLPELPPSSVTDIIPDISKSFFLNPLNKVDNPVPPPIPVILFFI